MQLPQKFNPLGFCLPKWEKIAPLYTSRYLAQNLLSDQLWVPLI